MPNYRRLFVPGVCWFFTVNLLDRRSSLLTDEIDALREATRQTMRSHPFRIDAFVVLPDHLHAISDPAAWRRGFLDALPSDQDAISHGRSRRASNSAPFVERVVERGIWQRRFWEHLIRDEDDYARHVAYCIINPVKHGLARRAIDWPYSSFQRDVRRGVFSADWGSLLDIDPSAAFGEREFVRGGTVGRNSEAYSAAARMLRYIRGTAEYAKRLGKNSLCREGQQCTIRAMTNRTFKTGVDRGQGSFLPPRIEDYVGLDNPVRAIEAYVSLARPCWARFPAHRRLTAGRASRPMIRAIF